MQQQQTLFNTSSSSRVTNTKHQYVSISDLMFYETLLKETLAALKRQTLPGTQHPITQDEQQRYQQQVKDYTQKIYGREMNAKEMLSLKP